MLQHSHRLEICFASSFFPSLPHKFICSPAKMRNCRRLKCVFNILAQASRCFFSFPSRLVVLVVRLYLCEDWRGWRSFENTNSCHSKLLWCCLRALIINFMCWKLVLRWGDENCSIKSSASPFSSLLDTTQQFSRPETFPHLQITADPLKRQQLVRNQSHAPSKIK